MRSAVLALALPAACFGQITLPAYQGLYVQPPTYTPPGTWAHRLTLTAAAVGSTLADFPAYVDISDAMLRTTANGGVAYDLVFGADSDCTSRLSWELEPYDGSNGRIRAHVRLTLGTSPTTFYACYGKTGINTFQSTPGAVWDGATKGRWGLGNGTTLNATDSTVYSNHGTLGGVFPTPTAGQIDGAFSFAYGAAGWIDVGTGSSLNITGTSITISAWVQSARNNQSVFCGFQNGGAYPGYEFGIGIISSGPKLNFWDSTGWRSGTVDVPDTGWHHIAVSVVETAGTFYVDGVAAGTFTSGSIGSFGGPRYIGSDNSLSRHFEGGLDSVRVSSVGRSPDWIAAEVASGLGTLVTKGALL